MGKIMCSYERSYVFCQALPSKEAGAFLCSNAELLLFRREPTVLVKDDYERFLSSTVMSLNFEI